MGRFNPLIQSLILFAVCFSNLKAQDIKSSRFDLSIDISHNIFQKRYISFINQELVSLTQNVEYNYSGNISYFFPSQKKFQWGLGFSYNEYNHSFVALYKHLEFPPNSRFPTVYRYVPKSNQIKIQTLGLTVSMEKKIFDSYLLTGKLNVEFPVVRELKYELNEFNDRGFYTYSETLPKNSLSFYNFIFPEINLTKYLSPNLAVFGGIKLSPFSFQNQYELVFTQSENVILDYQIKSDLYSILFGIKYSFQIN